MWSHDYHVILSLQAQLSLEMALSRDFEVKNHPLYHLISGCVEREMARLKEAQESLETALRLSRTGRSHLSEERGKGRGGLGLGELATVYLELVAVLTKLGKQVSGREGRRERRERERTLELMISCSTKQPKSCRMPSMNLQTLPKNLGTSSSPSLRPEFTLSVLPLRPVVHPVQSLYC